MSHIEDSTQRTSSPTSIIISGSVSSEDHDQLLPSTLASEELQLALNKNASEEELRTAINRCKNLVLESDHCSSERKWLVRHLIELRLRLQECREAMDDPLHPNNKVNGVSKRTIKGHHLKLQPLLRNTTNKYCDHCTGMIWSVVQAWYECEDCLYACHHKCLSSIVRECAHVIACERGQYELDICPEVGLSFQKYLCAECQSPMPVDREWSVARLCDYTGLYYCSACHWDSSAVVPARVVHNWDFTPYPVSQSSLQQLRVTSNRPMINLEKINPKLFSLIHELDLVRRLRHELIGMRKYLLVCRNAEEDYILWKNLDRPHLVENADLYSLQDLVDINLGELPSKLQQLEEIFVTHIKVDCVLCRGRGHICEVCSNEEILYPFDNLAQVCDACSSVLHKTCYARKGNQCPKCARIKSRLEKDVNLNGIGGQEVESESD